MRGKVWATVGLGWEMWGRTWVTVGLGWEMWGRMWVTVGLGVTPAVPPNPRQVLANGLDNKLRENLERLKKIRAHRGLRHFWG